MQKQIMRSLALLLFLSSPSLGATLKPTLILISLDGFRYDYLDRGVAPRIAEIAAEGVRSDALIPQFPTLTFPNHTTLVTGLYPAHHGITGNDILDPELGMFHMTDPVANDDPRWWLGEPIWVTAEKQQVRAGSMFWVGNSAPVQGILPSYFVRYDGTIPNHDRARQILTWLDLPEGLRPQLYTLYFEAVDSAGHKYGPDSAEVNTAISDVDAAIGVLVDGLRERGLDRQVHLVLVSDHGMAPLAPAQITALDQVISPDDVTLVSQGAFTALAPKAGREDAVYSAMKTLGHMSVYRRDEIPERYHYSRSQRITPIVAVADEGWTIRLKSGGTNGGGTHGFDPALSSMHGLFVASGPDFKKGARVAPFENIHLYSLMAHVLGLAAATTDGNLQAIEDVLRGR